jgi:hypothetical protein
MHPYVPASYETRDAEPRLVAWLAAGLAAFLLLTPVLLLALYPETLRQPAPGLGDAGFPAPRLQVDNSADLLQLRAGNDARLATFGWIDRKRKIVHLPIERAMSLTVERGLSGWPKP